MFRKKEQKRVKNMSKEIERKKEMRYELRGERGEKERETMWHIKKAK